MKMYIDNKIVTLEDIKNFIEDEVKVEVVCSSKKESDIFLKVLEELGYTWESGAKPTAYSDVYFTDTMNSISYLINSYDKDILYGTYPTEIYYYEFSVDFEDKDEEIHDEGPHGDQCSCEKCSIRPKEFTKSDLRSGDILIYSDGQEDIYIKELEGMIALETIENECKSINVPCPNEIGGEKIIVGYNHIKDFNEDLTFIYDDPEGDCGIEKVYRPNNAMEIAYPNTRKEENYVFIRKRPARMTLKEVCEALGYDVIIVD